MSLIHNLAEIRKACESLEDDARKQQHIYYKIIEGVVRLHQKYRLEKNFNVSDELRSLLNEVGIEIIQGNAGYSYEAIPESLKTRQVNDTWHFKV